MKRTCIESLLVSQTRKSIENLRRRFSNVRYGPPGKIYFDMDGKTYWSKEPHDVMPVGSGEASLRWAVRQYLDGAEPVNKI